MKFTFKDQNDLYEKAGSPKLFRAKKEGDTIYLDSSGLDLKELFKDFDSKTYWDKENTKQKALSTLEKYSIKEVNSWGCITKEEIDLSDEEQNEILETYETLEKILEKDYKDKLLYSVKFSKSHQRYVACMFEPSALEDKIEVLDI